MSADIQQENRALIRKTFIQCGVAVAACSALAAAAVIYHDGIAHVGSVAGAFMDRQLADFFNGAKALLASAHYSIFAALFAVYVWVSCTTWKLKRVEATRAYAGKLEVAMYSLAAVNILVLMLAMANQPSKLLEYYTAGVLIVFVKTLIDLGVINFHDQPKNH